MDCPRCRLSLAPQDYEGHAIQFCGTCWGFWVPGDKLSRILADETYKFSAHEKQTIFQSFSSKAAGTAVTATDAKIQCPDCSKDMIKKTFDPGCPVVVDKCDEHGTWLDTGEIKALQVYVETNR